MPKSVKLTMKPVGPGVGQIWKDAGGRPYILLAADHHATIACDWLDDNGCHKLIQHVYYYRLDDGQVFCTHHFEAYVIEQRGV